MKKKFEVVLNGNRTGIIIEAEHDVKAKAECRKRGYRCYSVIDLEKESREGKAEYEAVVSYLCSVEAMAELQREIDDDFGKDPMMALALTSSEDTKSQTWKLEKPDEEIIQKANAYAKEWDVPFKWSRTAERLHLYTDKHRSYAMRNPHVMF